MSSRPNVWLSPLVNFINGMRNSTADASTIPDIPLFYIAEVTECGDDALERFQSDKGFRPPEGTVRAKVSSENYLTKDDEVQIFYPLFPPHMTIPIRKGEIILVIVTNLGMSKSPSADGYWVRPAVREPKVSNSDDATFDPNTIGNPKIIYNNELKENENSSQGAVEELTYDSSEVK